MPTKRRRVARSRFQPTESWERRLLNDQPAESDIDPYEILTFAARAGDLWPLQRAEILRAWPDGSRPAHWWRFDAPRLHSVPERHRETWHTATMIEPRLLLEGEGRPAWETLSVIPRYHLGVPAVWRGYSAANPPKFESQFDYLQRHGLLRPGERAAAIEPATDMVIL